MPSDADWKHLYQRAHYALARSYRLGGEHAVAVVHQAIGMTMEYLDCPSVVALQVLEAQAEQTGQPITTVAADVIERRYRPC